MVGLSYARTNYIIDICVVMFHTAQARESNLSAPMRGDIIMTCSQINDRPATRRQNMVEIMRTVKAGDIAGDFTLQDHNGSNFILSGHRGNRVF